MLIVLPNKKNGLSNLEQKLEHVSVKDIMSQMKDEMLEVVIPKFKIETTVQLNEILHRVRDINILRKIKMGNSQRC